MLMKGTVTGLCDVMAAVCCDREPKGKSRWGAACEAQWRACATCSKICRRWLSSG